MNIIYKTPLEMIYDIKNFLDCSNEKLLEAKKQRAELNAKYIETLQVPKTHEMYLDGNRILNVYKIDIV